MGGCRAVTIRQQCRVHPAYVQLLNFQLYKKKSQGWEQGYGMCQWAMCHRSGTEVACPVAVKPCPSSTKEVTLLVGRHLESACRYSGHYSAQGNCRGCKYCIPWELPRSALGCRFLLKWKKGRRGAAWWTAMRGEGVRKTRNADIQRSWQKRR